MAKEPEQSFVKKHYFSGMLVWFCNQLYIMSDGKHFDDELIHFKYACKIEGCPCLKSESMTQ